LNSYVYKPRHIFYGSIENEGCTLLDCVQASPSEGCTMIQSFTSCKWCHVMCSNVFENINNLCSLWVIGKYLSYLYVTNFLPRPILGLYRVCPQVLHSIKFTSSSYMQKFGHISIFWYPRPKGFIMNLAA